MWVKTKYWTCEVDYITFGSTRINNIEEHAVSFFKNNRYIGKVKCESLEEAKRKYDNLLRYLNPIEVELMTI